MAYTAGLTEERHIKSMPARCGATVNPFRILMKGTDADEVIQSTGPTAYPEGVSGDGSENHKATYAENDPVDMRYGGIVRIKMSGAGLRDDRVISDSVGRGIRHVGTDGVYVVGHATKAWADGDIIPVRFNPYYVADNTVS